MTRPTLISYHLCPYVQRAAIAMGKNGVPFERINVDLASKPDCRVTSNSYCSDGRPTDRRSEAPR